MPDPDGLSGLARGAINYRRGIFCPAELWCQVADRLASRNAGTLLSALPPDLQGVLRECYRERALSLQYLARDDALFQEIERWCRQADT
jgi:hypothetical protein